jgi:Fe-S-cluster containining protein
MAGDDALKDGLIFNHHLGMQNRADLDETRATVYALLEELSDRGFIDLASLEARREVARALESERSERLPRAYVDAKVPDKYALKVLPDVDCRSLLPICQGRCCKLRFALSRQDVEERVVEWEFAAPYLIRHGDDQRCVHQERPGGSCGVYEHRPATCRTYDCRNDARIWRDFDKRILAEG